MDAADQEEQARAKAEEVGESLMLLLFLLFLIFEFIEEFPAIKIFFSRPQPYTVEPGTRTANGEFISPDNSPGPPPADGLIKQQVRFELQRRGNQPLAFKDLDLADPEAAVIVSDGRHIQCWQFRFTLVDRSSPAGIKLVKGIALSKNDHLLSVTIQP